MCHSEQLLLTAHWISHIHAAELTAISALLDQDSRIAALVEQDFLRNCRKNAYTGRPGFDGRPGDPDRSGAADERVDVR